MGFVEAVAVTVVAAAILASAGLLLAWRFGVEARGIAWICDEKHAFFVYDERPQTSPPHLDIALTLWARLGRATAIHDPTVKASQSLEAFMGPQPVTLPAEGTRVSLLLVMTPPEGEKLTVKAGDYIRVVLPMMIGHRTLRLKVQPAK